MFTRAITPRGLRKRSPIAEAGYYATERGDQTKETEQVQLVYTSPMEGMQTRKPATAVVKS